MLKTREYHNNAYQAHVNLAKIVPIKPRHFEIWLKLFSEQAKIDLNPLAAEVIISRATNIAKSLKIGMLPATN
jgi:hemoglobin